MCVVFLALFPLARSAMAGCPNGGVRIKASDPNPFDSFGIAVGISDETAVVGAFWDDQNAADAGAAYIFDLDGENWVQGQKLIASDGAPNNWFGYTIAAQGDTAIIGALQHDHDGESGNGPVYMFRRERGAGAWVEVQEVMPSDGAPGDGFSFSFGVSGDIVVVGAPAHDDNGTNAGAAYVFRFDGSQWLEEQELLASDPTFSDSFGLSVAVSADLVVIGAHGDDGVDPESPICDSGAAYVFRFDKEADIWQEEMKLTASDAACSDRFGSAVSISGEAALIGARLHNDNGFSSGAAYVYRFDPRTSQWVQEQKLLASDGVGGDQFGRALAMDGDMAVVGAWKADPINSNSGAAYVFRRNAEGVWTEQCKLLPQPNAWTQRFGWSVDIDGPRVIIGADGEDQQHGAAYIFDLSLNPADLDADGDVDAADLAELLAAWGPTVPCPPFDPADFDTDCDVDAADLAELLAAWAP